MKNEFKLNMYRVYGRDEFEEYDEYLEASSVQKAVDRVREWHSYDGFPFKDPKKQYEVIEVAKVVKGWK